ncbi:MAG TPA: enoyl-CoA hydratase-related protein [Baekduia sp.]|nr:enoyl-CoA hydratase-related protein [Baekduia sp.]
MPVSLTDLGAGVAELTIEGPIDLAWTRDLQRHAQALRARDDLRVVRLVASGRFFCPGGDLGWMREQPDTEAALTELAGTLHGALKDLAALDAPVAARVQGHAAGAGMSLVLGADLAVAAASAKFTMAYTGVGLSPDGGSSWLLPRLVGRRRAMEIMLLNRPFPAEEAARLGIVTSAVADEELDAAFDAMVDQLASGPTASYGAVKRLLDLSSQSDYPTQLDREARSIAELGGAPTGQEGIAAFLEKRPPQFPVR